MKHSPKPWIKTNTNGFPIICSGGTMVAKTDCSLNGQSFVKDLEEANANANLIAAAPELLEAAKDVAMLYAEWAALALPDKVNSPEFDTITRAVRNARKAIEKAEHE